MLSVRGVGSHREVLPGKRTEDVVGATNVLGRKIGAPIIPLIINGKKAHGLLDTGCSKTVVSSRLINKLVPLRPVSVMGFDGSITRCRGKSEASLKINGKTIRTECIVSDRMIPGVDVVVGTDVIKFFHLTLDEGKIIVAPTFEANPPDNSIRGRNFSATFNGGSWTVEWEWTQTPRLTNKLGQYGVKKNIATRFEKEIERWVTNKWLVPYEKEYQGGVIPLMAVFHEGKNKVRPVLDFRELNKFVSCSGAEADVCGEKLRKWRRWSPKCSLLDLKDAYMQIGVSKSCSELMKVRVGGKVFELTRLGFGLNCAPEIMKAIVHEVLQKEEDIGEATDSYYDDIIVNTEKVSVTRVKELLSSYGLECKEPVALEEAKVLGLKIEKRTDGLQWRRPDGEDHMVQKEMLTKRELFSVCGKLLGHYPVAGWLRTSTSFIKRSCLAEGWSEPAGLVSMSLLKEVLDRVKKDDPVHGKWTVSKGGDITVWCDASSMAYGVSLTKDGDVIEDGAWLRKKEDGNHINLAELTAVIKGVNMAIKWESSSLKIMTDSATVYSWINSLRLKDKRVKVTGLSEMLVKRRLTILIDTLESYDVQWGIQLVPTTKNKADFLTRVPKHWMKKTGSLSSNGCSIREIRRIHEMSHRGVDGTLHFVKKVMPEVSRFEVEEVVKSCEECQSIDPASRVAGNGKLSVPANWARIAVDITHVGTKKFLTAVDCGPSRFAIWKEVEQESEKEVVKALEETFAGYGPPLEILCDNGKSFRSKGLSSLCERWGVILTFRCAYKPSGNGVVERNHRTIKTMASRTKKPIQQCVFWYNATPGGEYNRPPSVELFGKEYRNPFLTPNKQPPSQIESEGDLTVGESVWVKPPGARCSSKWASGIVTKVNSGFNIEVDDVPRHRTHIRKKVAKEQEEQHEGAEDPMEAEAKRPERSKRVPFYFKDFITSDR
eukprot:TRINITY_DN944_c0_g1_i3.p1 TRINITY_DN944_c0_g1~~TRINITY_DN944_c0_g1_i3.p1  ORF type:complete len:942 (+),score=61.63 TRINITY_DN944_c0_g1_i3:649-3474(+)